MAPMIFTDSIIKNKPINIFNNGDMARDFTYIDDVTEILFRLISKPATANKNFNFESPSPESSWCKHKIFNVGNNNKIQLMDFINEIEKVLGLKQRRFFTQCKRVMCSQLFLIQIILRTGLDLNHLLLSLKE